MAAARTILHVDMDAFFVSVELLRRPDLVGQPVVVGGTGRRGVVAAASYEARRYGVFSAMPTAVAIRRCPHAVFLPGDHARYSEVSAAVMEIMRRTTPHIEPLSLDEAFLDVTGSVRLFGTGRRIAETIRAAIRDETGLTCSVGIAGTKFVAKMASVGAKPVAGPDGVRPGPGIVEIADADVLDYLEPQAVERLPGVGPATLERLHRLGVRTIGDLAGVDPVSLRSRLGRSGADHLLALAAGRDARPVESDRAARSIGHEETYPDDLHDADEIHRQLVRLADAVAGRLRAHGGGARTITLKVRLGDFTTVTRSVTGSGSVDDGRTILGLVEPLLAALDLDRGVRLLGISGSNLAPVAEQLSLLDAADQPVPVGGETDAERLPDLVDDIRRRFGAAAIAPASTIDGGRIRTVHRGRQQWGPNQGEPRPPR